MEPYLEPHHYTSIDEMLEKEELDILDICLPTYLHVPTAVKAMKKGIHVLSEKPISLKEEDIELMTDKLLKGRKTEGNYVKLNRDDVIAIYRSAL